MMKEMNSMHPSYTDEENKMVYDYIAGASEKELVAMVNKLIELYTEDVPSINEVFMQFEKELRVRDDLFQQKKALKKCIDDWNKYYSALFHKRNANVVRKKYLYFKENEYPAIKQKDDLGVFMSFIREYGSSNNKGRNVPEMYYCDRIIRLYILNPEAKNAFKVPSKPKVIYHSLQDVPKKTKCREELFESIGKTTLQYIVTHMLYNLGSPEALKIPIIIRFKIRTYANQSKKKNVSPFTTNMPSIFELIEENQKLFKRICEKEKECNELLLEIAS